MYALSNLICVFTTMNMQPSSGHALLQSPHDGDSTESEDEEEDSRSEDSDM